MKKGILVLVITLFQVSVALAATDDPAIVQAKALLDQYSVRVRTLEAENSILREEMRKANIQIPLSTYSSALMTSTTGSVVPNPPSIGTGQIVASGTLQSTGSTVVVPPPSPIIVQSGSVISDTALQSISTTYGSGYTGFISRIHTDWPKIRDVYAFPQTATIGGYEFVQTGAMDHVFVDVIYSGTVALGGVYDAKILYQYDKKTFARKLIGLFEYNTGGAYYTTKTGKNIFPGVKRLFIADPVNKGASTPSTASTQVSSPVGSGTTVSLSDGGSVSISDIETAYGAKRYLSVITLSESWLQKNTPTLDILRIRYRTYFIIGKYTEAIKEVERIKSIGQLSSAVACEGYVIATYAKDTTLADSYKTVCNKK